MTQLANKPKMHLNMKNKQNAKQHRFLSKVIYSLKPNLNFPVSLNSFNLNF